MHLTYHLAGPSDLDLLVRTRIQVLRAANLLPEDAPLPAVEDTTRPYYQTALANGDHVAYLVFDGNLWVGSGGVSFYQVMPTVRNPSGRKAYIMNMYTRPDYRCRGIASYVLDLLVQEARQRGVAQIGLEATAMGRPVYESYGFLPAGAEMELVQQP
jgi:GNAT superfamily N-acetyltransferase